MCQCLAFIVVTVAAGYDVKKASKDQTNIRAKKPNRQLKLKQADGGPNFRKMGSFFLGTIGLIPDGQLSRCAANPHSLCYVPLRILVTKTMFS